MDIPRAVISDLRGLVDSIGAGDDTLARSVAVLVRDVSATVSSFLGLRLTLVLDGWPVTLTWFAIIDGQRPTTSLRLPLSVLGGGGFDPDSHLVLYAGAAGALVDLAADLVYLERLNLNGGVPGHLVRDSAGERPTPADDGREPAVSLDTDLPPATLVSGLTGLAGYASINQAIGLLIERGHHPDEAAAIFRRDATINGMAFDRYAARLLNE